MHVTELSRLEKKKEEDDRIGAYQDRSSLLLFLMVMIVAIVGAVANLRLLMCFCRSHLSSPRADLAQLITKRSRQRLKVR